MASFSSTQDHLPIAGIQDGVIIMPDGSVRAVLKVEPTNFELKSELEQEAIIYSYQGFLNSLEFPIQIIIQSKKLDLETYLQKLETRQNDVHNELLRVQLQGYIEYLRMLISKAKIMSKHFYVSIAYSSIGGGNAKTQAANLFGRHAAGPLMDQQTFEKLKIEVFNRAEIIGVGLARIGSRAQALTTQELIELFYGIYNPDISSEERLSNVNIGDISSGIITSPEASTIGASQAEASTTATSDTTAQTITQSSEPTPNVNTAQPGGGA